jgi:hypothetical protein
MVVPFGISVGDFIAGIRLLKGAIDSFSRLYRVAQMSRRSGNGVECGKPLHNAVASSRYTAHCDRLQSVRCQFPDQGGKIRLAERDINYFE